MNKVIRIAVVMNNEGTWSAIGWGPTSERSYEQNAMGQVIDMLDDARGLQTAYYWVEAHIPLPVQKLIKGRLEKG